MIRIKPQLTGFDAGSLSLAFGCRDDAGIEHLRVRDRWGITVAESKFDQPVPFAELALPKVPRARTPFFIEGRSAGGAHTPPETLGAIFPSPTDDQHKAGVPLPRRAIDQEDPKIRTLKADAARWSGRYRAHRRHLQSLSGRATSTHERVRSLAGLLWCLALVLLILSVLPRVLQFPWPWIVAAALGVLLFVRALLEVANVRRVSRELRAVRGTLAEYRDNWQGLEGRLFELGVDLEPLSEERAGCGCGGGKVEGKR